MSAPKASIHKTARLGALAIAAVWLAVAWVLYLVFVRIEKNREARLKPYALNSGDLVIPRQRDGHFHVAGEAHRQPVRFLVDAYPEREFEGKVQQFRLNSTNTQGVITYAIVVAVSNPEELLKPGMTAQVRIVVAQKDRVTRVPTAALRFRPDEDELSKSAKAAASAKQIMRPWRR